MNTIALSTSPEGSTYPLSGPQREIWLDQVMHPEVPLYNCGGYARIDGPLDGAALERAIRHVVEENDALRLLLEPGEGVPTQRIAEHVALSLEVHDLSGPGDADARAREWMDRELAKRISLYNSPLFHFAVIKAGEERFYWLTKYHHVIVDAYAIALVFRRVVAAYNAAVRGEPLPEERRLSYVDFIKDDQHYAISEQFERDSAYFRGEYATLPEPLLPRRQGAQSPLDAGQRRRSRLALDRELFGEVQKFAGEQGVSAQQVILGALYCYFARIGQRDDVAIGLSTLNRTTADFRQTVGMFTNMVPIWIRLGTGLGFRDLLAALGEEARRGAPHRRFPLGEVNRRLGLSRVNRSQVFDVTLSYLSDSRDEQLGGAPVSFRFLPGFDRDGLTIYVETLPEGRGADILLDGSSESFTEDDIERLPGRLEVLLRDIVRRPEVPVRELRIMPEAEGRQILVEWNATAAEFPADKCVHELFEAQVEKTPDAAAAVFEEQTLSYRELNRRANRLAHALRAIGVGQDKVVALLMERGLELLISMLAVFKAGGAYVPLDPGYPEGRLVGVLGQSGASQVIATRPFVSILERALAAAPGAARAEVLEFEEVSGRGRRDDNLPVHSGPGDLAYVIYTSGSTGVPKGAMVEQRGMVNHLFAKLRDLELSAADVVAETASQCFDISVWQFLSALMVGGRVHIFADEDVTDPRRLLERVEAAGITILEVVPSLLQMMLDEIGGRGDGRPGLAALRWLILTGEALPPELSRAWGRFYPEMPLLNAYGPTECSDDVTHHRVDTQAGSDVVYTPIGRAIINTQLYVLDKGMRPLPIGVAGELYVGGTGVGRGYLGDPKRTAEVFVPDPFCGAPGARLYKTGDLCRRLPGGELVFMGRLDHQVKIRGYRIELGEIEAALLAHPKVRACVVVAREDAPSGLGAERGLAAQAATDKRLVAYVAADEDASLVSALREHLFTNVPEYMVPAAFVVLAALPLTPNGKIDRKALPEPASSREAAGAAGVPARTPTEQALVALCEDLLRVAPVGVTDDFFALGGNSLLAVRLLSAMKSKLGYAPAMASLFQVPTIEGLARLVDGTAERPAPGAELRPAPRAEGANAYRGLSGTERRMWFIERLYPEARSYQVPRLFRVEGALDTAALRASLDALAMRHELLRTTYPEVDGAPARFVAEEAGIPVRVEDVSSLPEAEREGALRALLAEEMATAFDLTRGPLTRVLAVRWSDQSHVVVMHQHHIVTDEWSSGVLLREWSALYEGARRGSLPSLPPLAFQYAEFARAEQEALDGEGFAASRAYWKGQLAGMPRLALPILRPSTGQGPGPEARVAFRLPGESVQAMRALCRAGGSTLFMGFYAALVAVLARYSGQTDVGLGAVIANREVAGAEGLLGFFTNTVVLRTNTAGDPSFRELLGRARDSAIEAYRHQGLPLDVVVQDQGAAKRTGDNPLYDVSFIEVTASHGGAAGWSPMAFGLPEGVMTAKDPLGVAVVHGHDGTEIELAYDTSRIERAAVERLLGHLGTLVLDAVARPDKRLSELRLLSDAELAQLEAWNDTAADYPADQCVHQLFEAAVAASPDAIAVEYEQERLTYAELSAQANRLAHHLRALGVGPDVRVGLCALRSPQMVIGILAILKAGGAYVPLDPAYPPERLSFMLEDARVPVLLTQARVAPTLPAHGAVVVHLDAEAPAWAALPEKPPESGVSPENLAYIIYTSGSTGRPKGTAMPHRALSNLLTWQGRHFERRGPARTGQFASLSFDVSFQEIFSTLASGGQLCLLPHEYRWDPSHSLALLLEGRIQRAFAPPVVINHWASSVASMPRADAAGHCEIIAAGEQLVITPAMIELFKNFSSCTLYNHYGPTETHVVTAFTCDGVPPQGPVSIGRPIDNTRIYVLDRNLQPMPVGIAGELYLAGVQVARGYLDRPGLTAERFVPDPFSSAPGARMYRTGDLARWSETGELEFLGRADHQVKIRGFRIELGEIEAALAAHPAVRASAVVAREDEPGVSAGSAAQRLQAPGEKRLVAYAVPEGRDLTPSALREHLRASLPEHMVPSVFVLLDALPLSPNGKIDRKALPAPEGSREAASASYVAPRTPTEQSLAGLWEELLGVGRVGVTDDFFALGGHSLLAVRLLAAMKSKLGYAPAMASLFQVPTIEGLARLVDGTVERPAPGAELRMVPRAPGADAYPGLSGTERRVWFIERLYPEARSYQVPQVFRVEGALDAAALRASLDALAMRHELLRTTYPEVDGGPVRRVANEARVPVRVEDVSSRPAEEREAAFRALLAEEMATAFDLTRGPLTRVLAVRWSDQSHAVVMTQHHIVTDEWSSGVLLRAWSGLYEAARRGSLPSLPPLAVQFAEYARAEQEALDSESFAASRAYWKAQLAGMPRLALPLLRPSTGQGPGPEARVSFRLPSESVQALRALCRAGGSTLFMGFYAALVAVLARYSGQADFGLGAVVANREVAGTEEMLGFFTNTVVLRTNTAGDPSFRELLARARATSLDAYRHQALPFDVVVQDQGAARRAGENPLYDVSFFEVTAPRGGAAGWSPMPGALPEAVTTAKDPLGIAVVHEPEGTDIVLSFDTSRLVRGVAERLLEHLRTWLTDAVARPDQRLSELRLLSDAELAQLAAWNATAADYPSDKRIHELVEAAVAKTPGAVALAFKGQELTYAELNRRANQLAHRLMALGVGPEVLVGVCVERSLEMAVGILGVLKAGGAYVPLDPTYPKERLRFMLDQARIPVLITQRSLTERLPEPSPELILIDEAPPISGSGDENPKSRSASDNVAYALYTSGSTGQPKAVLCSHRGVLNLLSDMQRRKAIGAGDRCCPFTNLSFDVSVYEIFSALTAGATLDVTPEDIRASGPAFVAWLQERHIQSCYVPPFFLPELAEAVRRGPIGLRRLLVGVEPIPERLLADITASAPGLCIVNGYGPTETSICATLKTIQPEVATAGATRNAPIGRPVQNTSSYVLDSRMELAPIGVAGELYIGGAGVARGYLSQPALTAERFMPDPFSREPGARMYRTGDLVRWNEDGDLEFLGRLDDQVKLRGFRVELGEVEAALREHPAVEDAAAIVHRERGDAVLITYVVPRAVEGLEAATPAALRGYLRGRLPGYMVPSFIVMLDRVPRTAGGKIDRQALPPPENEVPAEAIVPPRDDIEALIARVLGEVLGRAEVGVHHHFFDDLGGTSLSIVRAASEISRALGVEVPIVRFFEHPTVAALALGLRGETKAKLELRTASERARSRDAIIRARAGGNAGKGAKGTAARHTTKGTDDV